MTNKYGLTPAHSQYLGAVETDGVAYEMYRSHNPKSKVTTIYYRPDTKQFCCSAKSRNCYKCGYHFGPEDIDLDACPQCGRLRFCKQTVKTPGDRCRFHGGLTPKGAASSNFRHGRYSNYMPSRLRDRYYESVKDPKLLEIREDIALVDSRLNDLLARADTGEAGTIFVQAREAFGRFKLALQNQNEEQMRINLDRVDQLIYRGVQDFASWEEIGKLLEQRRKMVTSEINRLEKMNLFIPVEEVQTLMNVVGQAAKRIIKDPTTLNEFIAELVRVTNIGGQESFYEEYDEETIDSEFVESEEDGETSADSDEAPF